jgi:hypothetical protein
MFQCLIGTLPFSLFYLSDEPELLKKLTGIKETYNDYVSDKKGAKMKQFLQEYYGKGTGALDPSLIFEIICNKKKYFRNFSEQDSLDALLTLLDALIDSQKEVYRNNEDLIEKTLKIKNHCVPIGSIFNFELCNKRMLLLTVVTCKECNMSSWNFDPALSINAALVVSSSLKW